ncbi:MAG: hypothetical protein HN356_06910 [Calditrichaeota bacterium]|nr:hypothetical protein [Calditrichota bacterium]MBT7789176.1 hypothetical protein [Calditrichota bacterium]
MSIKIKPVLSATDRDEFIKLPYKLHSRWRAWIAPLFSTVKKDFDQARHPFFKHADIQLFLAQVNGHTLGRIAGIVDHEFITARNKAIGQFGFFDCVEDRDISIALFNTASQWLRDEGMVGMIGPTNPSIHGEMGVLMDSYEIPPSIRMVWNPPYYPDLMEGAGFSKAIDQYAYRVLKDNVSQKLTEASDKVLNRCKASIRILDMKNLDREIKIIRSVYNQSWKKSWGFASISLPEIDFFFKSLKRIIDPSLVLIAEVEGNPVGFSISLPDYNSVLKHLNGRVFPFGYPVILWYSRKIKHLRSVLLGVLPNFRYRGIETALYYKTWENTKDKKYDSFELSPIFEDNKKMIRAAKMIGAEKFRTYRLYQRRL